MTSVQKTSVHTPMRTQAVEEARSQEIAPLPLDEKPLTRTAADQRTVAETRRTVDAQGRQQRAQVEGRLPVDDREQMKRLDQMSSDEVQAWWNSMSGARRHERSSADLERISARLPPGKTRDDVQRYTEMQRGHEDTRQARSLGDKSPEETATWVRSMDDGRLQHLKHDERRAVAERLPPGPERDRVEASVQADRDALRTSAGQELFSAVLREPTLLQDPSISADDLRGALQRLPKGSDVRARAAIERELKRREGH
jgi:hypothetical protein